MRFVRRGRGDSLTYVGRGNADMYPLIPDEALAVSRLWELAALAVAHGWRCHVEHGRALTSYAGAVPIFRVVARGKRLIVVWTAGTETRWAGAVYDAADTERRRPTATTGHRNPWRESADRVAVWLMTLNGSASSVEIAADRASFCAGVADARLGRSVRR